MKIIQFLFLTLLFGILSCKNESKKSNTKDTNDVSVPGFEKDSAYQFVRTQVNFGPRVPNSTAHKNCSAWLINKFKSFGIEVIDQKFSAKAFDGKILEGINVIARINPNEKRRILLAAHWDSRPFSDQDANPENHKKPVDGADDGASGVGVLIELARSIQVNGLNGLGVDIVLFDCEDYGTDNDTYSWGLGSQYWSNNLHVPSYKPLYGILLDMVGATNPRFLKEGYSMKYASRYTNKIWALAIKEGFGKYFIDEISYEITDDHYFVNTIARIPMLDIINRPEGSPKGFVRHWHTQEDNLNAIDPNSLHMVGKVLMKLIYLEAANKI